MALSPLHTDDPTGCELPAGLGPTTLLEAVQALVLVMDPRGRLVFLNRRAQQVLGTSTRQARGLRLTELVELAPGQEEEREALARLASGPHPVRHECCWRTHDGRYWPLEWSTARLGPSAGDAQGYVVLTGVEVAERGPARQAFQEQLQFFQTLLDSIPNPLFHKTPDGLYRGCNRAFLEMVGTPREAVIGKSVWDMYPPGLAARYAAMDQTLFDNPGVQTYESAMRYASGEVRDVIFYKATYEDAHGKLGGLVGVILDITDRKRAEAALQKARDELEERVRERTAELEKLKDAAEAADRTKSQFLDIAAHELRTPLTALGLVLTQARRQLARQQPLSEATFVSRLERYTGRLTRLAGDLLDASRLEQGQLRLEKGPVDLRALVADVTGDFRQQHPHRRLELELPETAAWVEADGDRLEQVLANLLDNAMKYTPPEAHVAVRLTVGEGRVRVRVSDEGPGLAPEERALLFQRFRRLSSSIHQPGLGLGLYLSRDIIERHGGTLGAHEHEGRPGITFFFELPRPG
jgi:PAS domain S-box-containing protein